MQHLALIRKYSLATGLVALLLVIFWHLSDPALRVRYFNPPNSIASESIIKAAQEITLNPPPISAFGQRGLLSKQLAAWIDEAGDNDVLQRTLEDAVITLYPFLMYPSPAENTTPLAKLRKRQVPGSRGITIACGQHHFRYALHLIANLRDVLGSSLPIEVAYAGDEDLPDKNRAALQSLDADISFVDVLSVFNDETLQLREGKWAIKPFAVLASRFEQTIFMDADTVFFQKPEVLLDEHEGYKSTGALLFHDRLLWQNVFRDRTKWWHEQMEGHVPSAALNGSKVWMENYAEEGDSGVIVIDKRPTRTMLGLLHVAWQNSKAIRDEWTYKITYGDKESWWFGLELTGVPFAFEEHYGAVLGELRTQAGEPNICGFSIAHVDERQRLIWFNGSLLKNKAVNDTEYWVPSHWMVDGVWAKGNSKADMSCMTRGEPRKVEIDAVTILQKSVNRAFELDHQFKEILAAQHQSDVIHRV